jgi:hypothetical protein
VIFDALDLYYREQKRLHRRNSSRDELWLLTREKFAYLQKVGRLFYPPFPTP